MSERLLECRGISKTYSTATGAIEALHSVDASFAGGEIAAVVGASGSGKSTLLRLLAGLDRPSSGELLLQGRDVARAAPKELRSHRRRSVTYIGQKPADNLIPHLTLREHACDTPVLAPRLLRDVGLEHRLDARPIELSGGEQARAAFALALARETPVIVVDEPTAELDRTSAPSLLDAIRRHAHTGTAFVIATHDADVVSIADRVLRLDRGRVVTRDQAHAQVERPVVDRQADDTVRLEAHGVRKSFRRGAERVDAVAGADIVLRRGDVGVLVGRSGSGKSTLLTILAGWQPPEGGEIRLDGVSVNPRTLAWSQLSYVPQRFGLMPELSVRENVELPIRLGSADVAKDRVPELLDRLGLSELADRLPAETSIGQQQRAALARALVLRPVVLLADEPTSHQDAGWRDAVWRQLLLAAEEGTACLAATHEEHAARYATQLWEIGGGVVKQRAAA